MEIMSYILNCKSPFSMKFQIHWDHQVGVPYSHLTGTSCISHSI